MQPDTLHKLGSQRFADGDSSDYIRQIRAKLRTRAKWQRYQHLTQWLAHKQWQDPVLVYKSVSGHNYKLWKQHRLTKTLGVTPIREIALIMTHIYNRGYLLSATCPRVAIQSFVGLRNCYYTLNSVQKRYGTGPKVWVLERELLVDPRKLQHIQVEAIYPPPAVPIPYCWVWSQ